jgi:hypothetical protein
VNGKVGLNAIADRLNQDAIPSAMGCRPGTRWKGTWSSGTIRELIRNPAYRGATAWNRISYAKFHRVQGGQAMPRPKVAIGKVHRNAEKDWVVVEGTHEPLVSPDDFATAQRLLKSRSGTIGDAVRASKRNSPYMLSGLVRCAHCTNRWQGYKVGKGRKKPGEKRIETFYYACGGHVRKGNAVCRRALIAKNEFEQTVLGEAGAHLQRFVANGGAEVLEALILEAANPEGSGTSETALKEKLADRERRLNELIGCLTPTLAPALEPKIVALRAEVESVQADLEQARRTRLDAEQARAMVGSLVEDAARMGAVLGAATKADARDLLRALMHEIVVNPDAGEGEIEFHAIPRLQRSERTDGCSGNDERTERPFEHLSSHYQMAGARLVGQKRTCRVRVVRKPWTFRRLLRRRVAV